jgi:Domain of unknown function (DUF3846)
VKALLLAAATDFRPVEVETDATDAALRALIGGGWLEAAAGTHPEWLAYFDEEGKFKGLPVNLPATALARYLGWTVADVLVGDVVFLGWASGPRRADVPEHVLNIAREHLVNV